MILFLSLPYTFCANLQILHQGPRTEWIHFKCTYIGLRRDGLEFQERLLAQERHQGEEPNNENRRGALERCYWKVLRVLLHHFFILYGQRQHYDGLAMWHWYGLHPLFFNVLFFIFIVFSINFLILTSLHFDILGGSIIACSSIQHHIMTLESNIDIFKPSSFTCRTLSMSTLLNN